MEIDWRELFLPPGLPNHSPIVETEADVAAGDREDLDNCQDYAAEVVDEAGSSSSSSSSSEGDDGGSCEVSSTDENDDEDSGDGAGLASTDLIAEMAHYYHADLAAAAKEALLQAFTLLHGPPSPLTARRTSWRGTFATTAGRPQRPPSVNTKPRRWQRGSGPKPRGSARHGLQWLQRPRRFAKPTSPWRPKSSGSVPPT
ncbi:hypothetical protein ABZP36_012754 [Zizania latifolia]